MEGIMKIVKEIQDVIEKLPKDAYAQLRQWFIESDWEKWDKQIEDDYNKGKLDFLIREVKSDKANKKLKEL